jgi:hypothetical protein
MRPVRVASTSVRVGLIFPGRSAFPPGRGGVGAGPRQASLPPPQGSPFWWGWRSAGPDHPHPEARQRRKPRFSPHPEHLLPPPDGPRPHLRQPNPRPRSPDPRLPRGPLSKGALHRSSSPSRAPTRPSAPRPITRRLPQARPRRLARPAPRQPSPRSAVTSQFHPPPCLSVPKPSARTSARSSPPCPEPASSQPS